MAAVYRDQVQPIVLTLFGSLLTVEFLYTFTQRREILIVVFGLVYIVLGKATKHIVSRYPATKDGRIDSRRTSLTGFCGLGKNICSIIMTRLVFDMFMVARGKIDMRWWQYIDLFAIGVTFLSSFLVNK